MADSDGNVTFKSEYGTLVFTPKTGLYTFTVGDTAAVRALGADKTHVEKFTLVLFDGQVEVSKTLNITIKGINDAPIISITNDGGTLLAPGDYGDIAVGTDGKTMTMSFASNATDVKSLFGYILGADVDVGDTLSYTLTAADGTTTSTTILNGEYGTLLLTQAKDGKPAHYEYRFDYNNEAVKALLPGEQLNENFTISVIDGKGGVYVANDVTLNIVINGVEKSPTLELSSNALTAVEDAVSDAASSGTATHTNCASDSHEFGISAKGGTVQYAATDTDANIRGAYGSFTMKTDGTYTYTVNNSLEAVQALNTDDTLEETFTVYLKDGSTVVSKDVTVTVQGVNDAPEFGTNIGPVTTQLGTVGLVDGKTCLDVGQEISGEGSLTVTDVDNTNDEMRYDVSYSATVGKLTVDADGKFHYQLTNDKDVPLDIDSLVKTGDRFTVTVTDNNGVGRLTDTVDVVVKYIPEATGTDGTSQVAAHLEFQLATGTAG